MLTMEAMMMPMSAIMAKRPTKLRSRLMRKPTRLMAPKVPAVMKKVVAMTCGE